MVREDNRELVISERARYMAGEIDHQTYYLWLSDLIGLNYGHIPVDNDSVKASKDQHLNDIPLRRWDSGHFAVQHAAYRAGLPWSMSDTVCCLKAMARRRAERE